ncbi:MULTISPECIES: glycerophosphodiester phosphodiesterase family protein [Clostridia]|uniref:glycerophosphodiester phosphodiesterase n=1 Tax=Clostridia TaxID=186801 RepID=UPI000EA266AB|nr:MULTISPECIES: glycerophosphodiester phosphodiesterase family protein [Clostridia]NBJ68020.1 glycerophosphodiester phosphodiesterase [Roseburia sp. 1XD42-34]RKI82461.1 glycerophosphodiester phosphodiesterase [Clostridium sp. 1xD42-85]
MKRKKALLLTVPFILATSLFGGAANAAPSDNWLQSNKTELSAHRGAQVAAPENTLEAITQAGLLGYGFVEIDVQKTKDDQYILMHDKTIDRTTTGSGEVKDLTLEEIQSFDIEDKEGNVTDYKVPTLEEVLEEAHKYKIGINFDGSKGDWDDKEFVDRIVEEAKEAKVLNHSFFVLSKEAIRNQFNEWYPEATVTFLGNALKNADADIEKLKQYNNAIYTTSINNIDKKTAKKIKKAGLKLHVYSVNSAIAYEKAKTIHPRLIETDVIIP